MDERYIGIDSGLDDIAVEERYISPSPEYPDGSWLRKVGGEVMVATGYYATLYPDKPSPYFHGGPPFFVLHLEKVPWEEALSREEQKTDASPLPSRAIYLSDGR